MALDTKYRPLKFDDVIGQDATVKVLRRFVETGTGFHQSYLFCGGFGSGKTTLGRILARALLCESPVNGDPCDRCTSCRSLLERGSSDCFVEIDAATNSGKDDVRKIVDLLQYDTYSGRRRIYLFDESHRLSKDALDALLKPMEDSVPGGQDKLLVCIFCTTEPENMRSTVFSRCAPAFTIRMVDAERIADRLEYVCKAEDIPYERQALVLTAEAVECHIRDALKSIEGVSMMGTVSVENVRSYLRLNANETYLRIIKNLGHNLEGILTDLLSLQEIVSPATAYDKIAELAMLSYRLGHGVGRTPSFWSKQDLVTVWDDHQSFLLQVARTLSTKPGHPTYSMLECDLSSLHFYRTGGSPVPSTTISFVKPTQNLLTNTQDQSQDKSQIDSSPVIDSSAVGNGALLPEKVTAPPPVSRPVVTKGGVYIDPRGVNKRETKIAVDESIGTMEPAEFKRGLHRLLSELIPDGNKTG